MIEYLQNLSPEERGFVQAMLALFITVFISTLLCVYEFMSFSSKDNRNDDE